MTTSQMETILREVYPKTDAHESDTEWFMELYKYVWDHKIYSKTFVEDTILHSTYKETLSHVLWCIKPDL